MSKDSLDEILYNSCKDVVSFINDKYYLDSNSMLNAINSLALGSTVATSFFIAGAGYYKHDYNYIIYAGTAALVGPLLYFTNKKEIEDLKFKKNLTPIKSLDSEDCNNEEKYNLNKLSNFLEKSNERYESRKRFLRPIGLFAGFYLPLLTAYCLDHTNFTDKTSLDVINNFKMSCFGLSSIGVTLSSYSVSSYLKDLMKNNDIKL